MNPCLPIAAAAIGPLCFSHLVWCQTYGTAQTIIDVAVTLLQLEGDAVEAVMANAENFAMVLQPMYKALQVGWHEHLQDRLTFGMLCQLPSIICRLALHLQARCFSN